MVEQTKRDLFSLKQSTYLGLTQLLQNREEEDYNAYQRRQRQRKKKSSLGERETAEKVTKTD